MAAELKVPALGMDMEEVNIVRWLVEEGAEVEKGDPVLEIDTDKTSFEIEAPAAGVIQGLQGKEGDTLPVGATLAYIGAPGEQAPDRSQIDSEQEKISESHTPSRKPEPEPGRELHDARANGSRKGLRASPAARRAAADRDLDLESIAGSGPSGRVYLSDVLEADVRQSAEESPREPAQEASQAAPVAASRREALSRVRRLGAERTSRSFRDVPHFYLTRDLRAGQLVELAQRLKRRMDPAPTMTALLALAVSRTLRDHERLNGRYVEGSLEINDQVNLGIAVSTEAGLVVPVLRGADSLSLKEVSAAVRDLAVRTRESRLTPEELSGGTFTISNLGMMGVDSFDAVINTPEAAILAVGRTRTVPEWEGGGWIPRSMISVTLSIDHRVADGSDGAQFLSDLQDAIEDWEMLL